jgi:ribosomal-protein-alanine N-acetyltransferase
MKGTVVKIKIAEFADINNLFELNKLFENYTTKEDMENFYKKNKNEIICIAYIGEIAVGYCTGFIMNSICYNENRLDIESLYVKDEYRRKGIGKKLIKFIEKEAILKNITHFHINTYKKNLPAKSLYKKLGFNETEEILLDKTIKKKKLKVLI